MTISTQRLRFLRGNTAAASAFTGLQGELIVDTDLRTIRVQDGVTPGGTVLVTVTQLDNDYANVSANLANIAANLANIVANITSNIANISANTGNIVFSDQTLLGTRTDANITLSPVGANSAVVIASNALSVVGQNSVMTTRIYGNNAQISTFPWTPPPFAQPATNLQFTANILRDGIIIGADGHMGFNTGPDGYDFKFNGSTYSTEFYAEANFPTGYQFNTPLGDTGFSHAYDLSQGNISLLRIRHDSNVVARFYENLTTTLSGNLTVTQNGTTFGSFPNAFVQVYSNVNSYSQSVFQNINNNPLASTDIILTAGNGNDSAYFGDFGIASNTYSYPGYGVIKPNDVYLLAAGNNITGPGSVDSANLILGTTTGNIKMFVGAPEDANVIVKINTSGILPGANVTYSLGSNTYQWKDLWLSNSTIYLGGTPLTIANGVLSVNGSAVSGNYSNSNVASYLPTYTGNVNAAYYFGNGSQLTGLPATYSNTNVAAYLVANPQPGTYSNTNVTSYLSGNVSIGNLTANTNVTVTSNLIVGSGSGGFLFRPLVGGTGATIYGLGAAPSQTNYALSYNGASLNLNAPTGGGIYSSIQNTIVTTLTSTGLVVTGVLSTTGNTTVANLTANGNISATYFTGNGSLLTGISASANYSNTNVSAFLASFGSNAISTTGNITAGNIIANQFGNSTGTTATYTGNVTGSYFLGNGSALTGITNYSNTNVASYLTGNVTVGNISGSQANVTLVANTTSYIFDNVGNITIPGNINYANGINILSGISGNYGNTQVAAYLPTYTGNIAGNIVKSGYTWSFGTDGQLTLPQSTQGGIPGGWLTSTSNVGLNAGGNLWRFGVDGTMTSPYSVKITTTGIQYSDGTSQNSAYGNTQVAAYLPTYAGNIGTTGANVTATQYGNSFGTTATYSGNVTVNGLTVNNSVTIGTTLGVTGNVTASNLIGVHVGNASGTTATYTGNVTGNYFFGNGSQLTGLPATYGNSNVTTLLASLGSNSISTTGNIAASYFSGNGALLTGISSVGNIYGSSSNVTLVAGSYQWLFDNTGNLTLPANTFAVYYANGTIVSLGSAGSTYSNTNVASYLPTYTGNIGTTGANVIATHYGNSFGTTATYSSNATINALSVNNSVTIGTTLGVTGNITAANINATQYGNSIGTTATYSGNVTGNYFIGNGALLTGIAASSNYSNTNVAAYLPVYGGPVNANVITGTANATVNGLVVNNSVTIGTTLGVTGNITAGNISATQYGNSFGTTATYSSNVTVNALTVNNSATVSSTLGVTGNITTSANVTVTANVVASNFVTTGSGGNISGVNIVYGNLVGSGNTTVQDFTVNGNTTIGGTVTSNGNTNATAFAVSGAGAVSNVALGFFPPVGTAAMMAIRDYSTVNSTVYFDTTIGSGNIGGSFQFRGSNVFTQYAQIDRFGVTTPTRPAFRVYGNTSSYYAAGTTIVNQAVDYNQGSNYINSTGIFTAPVAGLYHAFATLRVGNNNGLNQASIQKNSSNSGANVIAFWETDTNTGTATHFPMTGYAKLAVGDTLRLQVITGNVQLDANDSWGVTYIG